jgi:hypothetical protein
MKSLQWLMAVVVLVFVVTVMTSQTEGFVTYNHFTQLGMNLQSMFNNANEAVDDPYSGYETVFRSLSKHV